MVNFGVDKKQILEVLPILVLLDYLVLLGNYFRSEVPKVLNQDMLLQTGEEGGLNRVEQVVPVVTSDEEPRTE